MSETDAVFPDIDRNVAANVRAYRERGELSQEELALRMSERGFGFSQATIWKIESGQRTVKISEAVALSEALGLPGWRDLAQEPEISRHYAQLDAANRRVYQAYGALKAAAAAYLQGQVDLSFVVRDAQDAGVPVHEVHTTWLDIPAEKVVIEARVEQAGEGSEEAVKLRQHEEVNAIVAALRERGYTPPRPEDWVTYGAESATSGTEDAAQGNSH